MKRVYSNKVYDTDTASELVSVDYGRVGDFDYYTETLYVKKTGEYFLYGEGGPMTRYSKMIGQNEWSGGEKIIPLSYDSARKWAEENLTGAEYESLFEVQKDDDSKTTINVKISTEAKAALDQMRSETGKTQAQIIESLIFGAR